MDSFGSRLKKARIDKGFDQKTLASMLGKDNHSIISNWENDRAKPSADDLVVLADMLGLSIDYLLKGQTPSTDEYKAKYFALLEQVQDSIIEKLKN